MMTFFFSPPENQTTKKALAAFFVARFLPATRTPPIQKRENHAMKLRKNGFTR
jgi:hypothetical protein